MTTDPSKNGEITSPGIRERTIREHTDTIRYKYWSVYNGRYWYRYEYSLSQPLILLVQAGRLENTADMQWVAHFIHG